MLKASSDHERQKLKKQEMSKSIHLIHREQRHVSGCVRDTIQTQQLHIKHQKMIKRFLVLKQDELQSLLVSSNTSS